MPSSRIGQPNPVLYSLQFVFIIGVSLFFSFRQLYSEDIGFHLQAARWMLENFSFPHKDTFTHTANANDYIDLNWLYQLLMYGSYSLAGSSGLILVNSTLIFFSLIVLLKRIQQTTTWFLPFYLLIGVIALSTSFEVRPHSLSWLFLNLTVYILEAFYNGNEKKIRWLPPLMLVWANSHSLFILGLTVTGCYGLSIFLNKKGYFKKFIFYSALAIVCCFINPYGWHGFSLPFEQVLALQKGNIFKQNIIELQSPFLGSKIEYASGKSIFEMWMFFDLFLAISVLLFLLRIKKHKIHEWLIAIIFFYFAYSAIKNAGYFIFTIIPIATNRFIESATGKSNKTSFFVSFIEKQKRNIAVSFMFVCLLLMTVVRTNAFYIHYHAMYRFGFDWSDYNLPISTVEFMNKKNIKGKILNALDQGGYLEFFTDQKTSIDGRLDVMGEKIFEEQSNATTDDAKNKLIDKLDPDIILFRYSVTPDWILYMQNQSSWRLVFIDGNSALYLKNSNQPEIQALTENDILSNLKQLTDPEIDAVLSKSKTRSFLSPLVTVQYFPKSEINRSLFCFYYNWIEAAKQIAVNGFERSTSDYPELYQNLGSIFFQLKDKNRSLLCYEKFLSKKKNEGIEKRVQFLKSLN